MAMHDIAASLGTGCTGFVAVFGGTFDPKRAQATTERLALLLGKPRVRLRAVACGCVWLRVVRVVRGAWTLWRPFRR